MKIVNREEFEKISANGYTLVDFYADWCGPCKMLAPVLEDLASLYSDIDFVKVNVDNEEELAAKYGVMSIPALFLLKDGEVLAKTGGYQAKEVLKNFIDSNLK